MSQFFTRGRLLMASGVLLAAAAFYAATHVTVHVYAPRPPYADSIERVAVQKAVTVSAASVEIARTGSLTLYVDDVDRATQRALSLARRRGAIVTSFSASSGSNARPAHAIMQIRVRSTSFDAAMAAFASLGTVRERSLSADDLSRPITDSSARLRNLERTELDIRKIMDRSGNVEQVMDVESHLSDVRGQIETLEADLKTMNGRVAYATIDVHFLAQTTNAPPEGNAFARLAGSARAAVRALSDVTIAFVSALVWLVVFAPYLFAGGAVVFFARLGLRKYAIRR